MKKEYGWVKAKKKTNWWLSKKERERELSNWNKIIGLTYFFLSKKNLQTIIWGFGHVLSEGP